jgi:hypothetical protein
MGKSFGKILTLPPMPSYRDLRKRAKNILMQGMFGLAVVILLVASRQPQYLLCIPVIVTIYVVVHYRKVYYPQRDWYTLLYYVFMHFCKPLVFYGVLSYLFCHSIRRIQRIGPFKRTYDRDR